MPIQIGNKEFLLPREVRAKFTQEDGTELSESKLRRLAQRGIIPSIPAGKYERFYDEQELDALDPAIWKRHQPGVKKAGEEQTYYSQKRRKS